MQKTILVPQMTATKVMDVIERLPDCDKQAADAVPDYTRVKMEDAPRLLRIPMSECPDIWIRLPRHMWPKSWSNVEDPVVHLERNLFGHPPLVSCGRGSSKELFWDQDVKKGTELGNACLFIESKDHSHRHTWNT